MVKKLIVHPYFKIDPSILQAADQAMEQIAPVLEKIEETTCYNQQKMQAAFSLAGVSESHFVASTGYGYGDRGRDDENQRIHQYPVRCFIYGDGRSLGTARGDG